MGILELGGEYRTVWRRKVCSSEIMTLRCYGCFVVLGAADGNLYFWNTSTNILQSDPMPSFNKINLYFTVSGLFFDEQGVEGVVTTS